MTDRKPDLDAARKSVTLAARMLLDLDDWGVRHAGIALALAQALDALGVTDEAPVDISNPAIRGQAKPGHRASAQVR
jgi:hypothetical protein